VAERSIAYMPVDELVAAPRNPKKHDLDGLADSFNAHGFVEPCVMDNRTGKLVSGHGRLEAVLAAKQRGEAPPDGIVDRDGTWLIPVVGWESADDAQAERYLLVANRLTEKGGWDDTGLVQMLEDLKATEPGLVGTGYYDGDLESLLAQLAKATLPPDGADDESGQLDPHFSVMIECDDEQQQTELLERLLGEGLTCRALLL
jgi:ParB-like chromosome segregation protein Spo0J